MVQITLEVPEALVEQLLAVGNHLPKWRAALPAMVMKKIEASCICCYNNIGII
jgi:hypothetical protein